MYICEPSFLTLLGNGPSAIFLSLLLSGYTPSYNGSHPNPYLATKLQENRSSLLDQVKMHSVINCYYW